MRGEPVRVERPVDDRRVELAATDAHRAERVQVALGME